MSQKTQTQNREILTGTRTIMVGFCQTQSAAFLKEASEHLFSESERAKADSEGRELFEARQTLEAAGDSLCKRLENKVKERFKATFPTRQPSANESSLLEQMDDELGLVDDAQMEITVAINSMSHRQESECADHLFGLAKRMALLNRGIKIDEELAPYSPRTFCDAYLKFLEGHDLDQPVRLVLLKMFERFFMRKLGSLYEELNQYLIAANVLPNLRYQANNLVKPRRRKSDQQVAESEQRQSELYKNLESIISGENVPIDPRQPVMPLEQVIAELSAMQQQQQAVLGGDLFSQPSMPTFPSTNTLPLQQVLEVVSTLFGMVNTETQIASPVKTLFSHLQAPYAKLALQDPSFLQNPQHVARKLFSSMIGASEKFTDAQTSTSNELVQRISAVVERIMQESSGNKKQDLELFAELLNEFSSYVESFEHKVKLTEQRSVQAAQGREKLKENQLKVEEIIARKVDGEELPGPVAELVNEVWSSYLTYTLLRHGEDSDEWKQAVRTVDTVLWYIEPKTNAAETKLAKDIRDSLHETLQAGMQNVGLDAAEIKSKLAALDLCQKLATENAAEHSGGKPPKTDQAKAAPAKPGSAKTTAVHSEKPAKSNAKVKSRIEKQREANAKASAEEQQRIADYANIPNKPAGKEKATGQPDVLGKLAKSLDGQAKAKAAGIDKTPEKPSAGVIKPVRQAPQDAIDKVLQMKFGTWLLWEKPGEKMQELKLTWYNSRTQNCMLSNNRGKEVAVVTANVIALGMLDGWVTVVEKEKKKPLFERMLESIGGQAPAATRPAATASYARKH